MADRVRELERENARLKAPAQRAEGLVEIQKTFGGLGIELHLVAKPEESGAEKSKQSSTGIVG